MEYYVAACKFTAEFPRLSLRIQNYAAARKLKTVRCCLFSYKVKEHTDRIKDDAVRERWTLTPESGSFGAGDKVYAVCPNCLNIIAETFPAARTLSLWELIDGDPSFPIPDLKGERITLQDCWRTRDRPDEQEAVRSLLRKMRAETVDLPRCRADSDFCGSSLYRPQMPRNARYAHEHYVTVAQGKFRPHTAAEQTELMVRHAALVKTERVIAYCHYCLEGLIQGGLKAVHLAEILFPEGLGTPEYAF